jgi:hypothetical protein
MCPVCLATAALVAGSATSTGGVTALLAATFLRRKPLTQVSANINAKENRDGHNPD